METWYYEVVSIDGDYANLRRTDIQSDDLKLVARALLHNTRFPYVSSRNRAVTTSSIIPTVPIQYKKCPVCVSVKNSEKKIRYVI